MLLVILMIPLMLIISYMQSLIRSFCHPHANFASVPVASASSRVLAARPANAQAAPAAGPVLPQARIGVALDACTRRVSPRQHGTCTIGGRHTAIGAINTGSSKGRSQQCCSRKESRTEEEEEDEVNDRIAMMMMMMIVADDKDLLRDMSVSAVD